MTMFTIAGTSVTEEEFGRAAKICLERPLDKSVVNTVFNIFDVDGDGKLSYKEFLSVMKSWKLRGFKVKVSSTPSVCTHNYVYSMYVYGTQMCIYIHVRTLIHDYTISS